MSLKVTLVKAPGSVALSRNNHTFDQRGGTFGRAESNTWVLPDPDKFLSSCHCAIVCTDNFFYLEDKSTNGTFVNGGFEPIGRGIRHQLRDDDYFEIGDYRFSIQLGQALQENFSSPFDEKQHTGDDFLFGNASSDVFSNASSTDSVELFDQQSDPLALWDKNPKSPPSMQFNSMQGQEYTESKERNSLLDDFVGLGKPVSEEGFSPVDISAGIDQSISWPSSQKESLIPENWDDDLDVGISLDSSVSTGNKKPIIVEDNYGSPFASNIVEASAMPFDIPKPSSRIPLTERVLAMEKRATKEQPPSVSINREDKVAEPSTVVPIPVADRPSMPVINQTKAVPNQTLIEALGLDLSRLSDADVEEINRISGLLIREIVDGMLGVLRSRASIKNEFRMNVTTIQPIENNPLKFSVCVDDALENLFIKKSNAYKKPVEAFREGFQEIAEHQLAMIAGIRQGFDAMMERFDPEQLEKSFSKQTKGSVIPGMQKAKFWNSYTDYYQGFSDNMESSFQHLFGSDFVSAYEDQLRRLAAARKRGESNETI